MNNEMNQMTVTAPDIVCGGCATAIKNAIGKIEGISKIDVDVENKKVRVEHNGGISREKIVETLDDAGFPSE